MNLKVVIGTAALAVLAVGAVSAQGASMGSKADVTFASVDGNKDGHISKDEVRNMEEINSQFTKLDANADGMLSQAEFGKYTAPGASSSSTPGSPSSSSVPGTDTKGSPQSTDSAR